MIALLNGILASKSSQTVIVESAGVGYQLMMPLPDIASLPAIGSQVRLCTYLQIKDDSMNLYGFANETEKEVFIQLIGVSNVGPKAALNILSHLPPAQLIQAIVAEDAQLISGAPGVGKKTAQRLILELKEKLGAGMEIDAVPSESPIIEARQALIGLGYQPAEAVQALVGVAEDKSVDWCIKFALKKLAKV